MSYSNSIPYSSYSVPNQYHSTAAVANNPPIAPLPGLTPPSSISPSLPYHHPSTMEQLQSLIQPLRYIDKPRLARDINGLLRQTNSLQCKVNQLSKKHTFITSSLLTLFQFTS